jgi:hypothetical protein
VSALDKENEMPIPAERNNYNYSIRPKFNFHAHQTITSSIVVAHFWWAIGPCRPFYVRKEAILINIFCDPINNINGII